MNWVVCRTDKQNEQITKINKADTHDRDPVYNPHSKFNHTKEDRVQLKPDGTRWRTGGEVKGKLVNGVGSQYSSLPRNMVYPALLPLMRTPRLPVVDWTDAPADLNGLVRFAERQNMVSARVPSHFKPSLPRVPDKNKEWASIHSVHGAPINKLKNETITQDGSSEANIIAFYSKHIQLDYWSWNRSVVTLWRQKSNQYLKIPFLPRRKHSAPSLGGSFPLCAITSITNDIRYTSQTQ